MPELCFQDVAKRRSAEGVRSHCGHLVAFSDASVTFFNRTNRKTLWCIDYACSVAKAFACYRGHLGPSGQ